MTKSTLKFEIDLDGNKIVKSIQMSSSDNQVKDLDVKSIMVSAFETLKKDTLTVNLWTRDMMVHDMFIMYHQTLLSMANSLEKSTNNRDLAEGLRDYCAFFAEKTKILDQKG